MHKCEALHIGDHQLQGQLRNHICIIPGKSDWIYGICPLTAIVFIVVFIIVQSKEGSGVFIPVGEVCKGLSDSI
jgi:hypothetical protein